MGQRPGRREPQPWKGLAVPRYNKRRKRLSAGVLAGLNAVQARIIRNPTVGDRKRGTLRDVWVEKFQAENDQYLVAYAVDEERRAVVFYDVGQHENFYRDLTHYLLAAPMKRGKKGRPSSSARL